MPDDTSKSSAPDSSDTSGGKESLTPAQLRAGVKITARPNPVTITVIGISGKPR